MTNVRYLGMICGLIGLLCINYHVYTPMINWGMFILGLGFYAIIGYMENYQHKKIRIGDYGYE